MKDQVLKLCKRLKICTHNDLLQFLDIKPEVLDSILIYLKGEGKIRENNDIYSVEESIVKKKSKDNKNLNIMYMYHTPEIIDLIVRGFCANIPTTTLTHLIKIGDNCIGDFYRIFRNLIYERQEAELLNYYFISPQQERYRMFFNKEVYFHVYNNQIYVIKKALLANYKKNFTDDEIQEFKKVYSYLTRIESHNKNETCLHQRLAEGIWRRNKSFNELYSDLKNLLFS